MVPDMHSLNPSHDPQSLKRDIRLMDQLEEI